MSRFGALQYSGEFSFLVTANEIEPCETGRCNGISEGFNYLNTSHYIQVFSKEPSILQGELHFNNHKSKLTKKNIFLSDQIYISRVNNSYCYSIRCKLVPGYSAVELGVLTIYNVQIRLS